MVQQVGLRWYQYVGSSLVPFLGEVDMSSMSPGSFDTQQLGWLFFVRGLTHHAVYTLIGLPFTVRTTLLLFTLWAYLKVGSIPLSNLNQECHSIYELPNKMPSSVTTNSYLSVIAKHVTWQVWELKAVSILVGCIWMHQYWLRLGCIAHMIMKVNLRSHLLDLLFFCVL